MTTQPIARLERKQLKEACGMWGSLSLLLLILSIALIGTPHQTFNIMSDEAFKFVKIALYMSILVCFFYTVFKTTVSYLKFKAIKI